MHSPRQRTLRAHAKVNLFLRILSRDTSGYHGIETLFQRIALHDIVHVALHDERRTLDCDGPALPSGGLGAPDANLAWRAALAYTQTAAWDTGWHIAVEKHIPVGGGLGGGSADAAAVLRAFEALSPHPLGERLLTELAGTLGADVPFLLGGASRALGWHHGNRLLSLPPLAPMAITLVTFETGVNTGAAYGAFARMREETGEATVSHALRLEALESWEGIGGEAINDFERVVPALHPGVAATLPVLDAIATRLRDEGLPAFARMSGSGATCYLVHPAEATLLLDESSLPAGASVLVSETL